MLSDEEKEALRNFKSEYETCDHYSSDLIIELDDAEIILNLIEKQSKEIEELKEQCKEVVCIPEGTCFMLEPKNVDKKWEDKIKAKIEELIKEGNYRTVDNPNGRVHFQKEITDYQIEVLQSLLEKEGE